jgi:hypothetical protein
MLDSFHRRAVIAGWLATTALVLLLLEWVRIRTRARLAEDGFVPWGNAGFYVHAIAGRIFSIASLQSQWEVAGSAVLAGLAAFMLCLVVALLDMRVPFRFVRSVMLLACIVVPFAWFAIDATLQPAPGLTLDLAQGRVTTSSGKLSLGTSNVARFDTYEAADGKNTHYGIGMLTGGSRQTKLLRVPSSRSYDARLEAQRLADALQAFLASGGQHMPATSSPSAIAP